MKAKVGKSVVKSDKSGKENKAETKRIVRKKSVHKKSKAVL